MRGKILLVIHTPAKHSIWRFPEEKAENLKKKFPEIEIHLRYEQKLEPSLIGKCQILVTGKINSEDFRKAKELKWIHSPFTGIGNFLFPELVNSRVLLTNSRGVNSPSVVEHIFGLMFAFSRYLYLSWKYQSQKLWAQEIIWNQKPLPRELSGRTIGIIGLGEIGQKLAERAKAFEMKVMGIRKNIEVKIPEVDLILPLSRLDFLLGNSDYVVLTLPRTKETEGLIDYERLKKMKREAILINVSRGKIIKEKDLVKALKEKLILGAGLDVFENEPLLKESELYSLPNVIITPHVAGVSPHFWDNVYQLLCDNLNLYLKGLPLKNRVKKSEGY
ncbi:MAG: D-2-hydroxyacid dehydrogenase [Candidatus Aminicenantia bacterium]